MYFVLYSVNTIKLSARFCRPATQEDRKLFERVGFYTTRILYHENYPVTIEPSIIKIPRLIDNYRTRK